MNRKMGRERLREKRVFWHANDVTRGWPGLKRGKKLSGKE